jgi:farnesyl diphosphate synthase
MGDASQTQFQSRSLSGRLSEIATALDALFEDLLSDRPEPGETARPARLLAAMRHAVFAGGKRFRPFLLVETARLCGHDGNGVLLAGAAVEALHTYSLIHDDLPAMDDDDTRRGQPTVHRAFDEATAILAGDALQTLAFDILSREALHPDPAIRIELVARLARAAGLGGMAGGQMLDLAGEGQDMDEAAIRMMQAMKTGALISACCEMGAAIAGASEAERRALKTYGDNLGLAFQIADDLLDLEGDAGALGKATEKDAARGKATFAAHLGREHARAILAETVGHCETALRSFGAKADMLIAAARFAADRSH